MAGRRPLPTAVKFVVPQANGSRPPANEPRPTAGAQKPDDLSPEAAKQWDKIVKTLTDAGIMTVPDSIALALYCEAFALHQKAMAHLRSEGPVVPGEYGPKMSPWFKVQKDTSDRMLKMLIEFGMTPASRSRLQAANPSKPKGKLGQLRAITGGAQD